MANKDYGKVANRLMTYAPDSLVTDHGITFNPSEESYRAAGWLKNYVSSPSPESGYHVSGYHWEEQDGRNLKVWEYAVDEKVPRTFSKLKLIVAMKAKGYYTAFKSALVEIGLEDEWQAAQNLSEDYAGWSDYLSGIKAKLGLTDEQVEEVLAASIAE